MGPLGGLATNKMFDDKMTTQDAYRFDGAKGGDQWKGRTKRYLMAKVPAAKAILEWAEAADDKIIDDLMLKQVTDHVITDEQRELFNSAIWGFLSGCLTGEAETVFKRAEDLNGVDSWRRIVRYIDHGRGIRLEALRSEVRSCT